MLKQTILIAGLVFAVALSPKANCQDDPTSLGEAAKAAKKNKPAAQAKKIVTEDDLEAKHGPLPRLHLVGDENSAEIIKAIHDYSITHPAQLEQVLHDWYDEYDNILSTAIHETKQTREQRASTNYSGYQLCMQSHNYQQCQARQQAEMLGARDDQMMMQDDVTTIAHIQDAFTKIRSGIATMGFHYEWFKIRNAIGVGSF